MTNWKKYAAALGVGLVAASFSGPTASAAILINEVDSDTPAPVPPATVPLNDSAEFIELFDTAASSTSLNGLVLVFFNGNGDTSYFAIDLDGYSTGPGGFFVAGNAGVPGVPAGAAQFPANTLQNGADAVALYTGNATDFPNGTAVTTTNLLDAVVYDTADADDTGLLPLLNAGQPQVDEAGAGTSDLFSIGRFPDGAGGARNTSAFGPMVPTPGTVNSVVVPEPAAAGLAGIAALGLLARRRRTA